MNNSYSVYRANPTMRMLGQQTFLQATRSPELKELEAAYNSDKNKRNFFSRFAFSNCFDLIVDVFNLGVIIGIRKERQRRKKQKPGQRANADQARPQLSTMIKGPDSL